MIDKTRMTAGEFLSLPESQTLTQLIEGEIVVSPAPTLFHQRIVAAVYRLLFGLVPDGEVFISPVDLHLDEDNVLEPDILWVSAGNDRCRSIEGKYLQGPPDLCVEVISPGTARQDRTTKFLLYEKYGVREYWIADTATKTLEVWQLQAGQFIRQGGFTPADTFISAVLGNQAVNVRDILDLPTN